MISLKNNLNFFENYFNGVQDIVVNKSAKQLGLGILKIVSYVTLVLPIIFGVGYLIIQSKIKKMTNLYNRVSLVLKSQNADIKSIQKDLLAFASAKVKDGDYEEFASVLSKLDHHSQDAFFAAMANTGKLIEVTDQVPEDKTDLRFHLGNFVNQTRFSKAGELAEEFLGKLDRFSELQNLHIDMSRVACITKKLSDGVQAYINLKRSFASASCGSSYSEIEYLSVLGNVFPTNSGAARMVLNGMVDRFHTSDSKLKKVSIRFGNGVLHITKTANSTLQLNLKMFEVRSSGFCGIFTEFVEN